MDYEPPTASPVSPPHTHIQYVMGFGGRRGLSGLGQSGEPCVERVVLVGKHFAFHRCAYWVSEASLASR